MMRMKVIVRINHIGNYPKNSADMEIYHSSIIFQKVEQQKQFFWQHLSTIACS